MVPPFGSDLLKAVQDHFGIGGVLLLALCALAIFAWYQHHKARLLQDRIDLEATRLKAMTEDLLRAQKEGKAAASLAQAPAPMGSASVQRTAELSRVLLVDDDEVALILLETLLRKEFPGLSLQTGADGRDALAGVREFRPHVLVLDLMMPRVTGWDVLAELKRAGSTQRVIVFTGVDSHPQSAPVDPSTLKNVSVVPKSSDWEELMSAVRAQLAAAKGNGE